MRFGGICMDIPKQKSFKKLRKITICSLILILTSILITGCARYPEEPSSGGETGQKQLIIKVEINEEGTINVDDGYYYIVFDTEKTASFAPDSDLENWKERYYYVRLDDFGFRFGQVDSSWQYVNIGSVYENYFKVTINLDDLENPEKIRMNIITTDRDNETIDYMDTAFDLSIDTSFVPSTNVVIDYQDDANGNPDYDLTQITTTLLIP